MLLLWDPRLHQSRSCSQQIGDENTKYNSRRVSINRHHRGWISHLILRSRSHSILPNNLGQLLWDFASYVQKSQFVVVLEDTSLTFVH